MCILFIKYYYPIFYKKSSRTRTSFINLKKRGQLPPIVFRKLNQLITYLNNDINSSHNELKENLN